MVEEAFVAGKREREYHPGATSKFEGLRGGEKREEIISLFIGYRGGEMGRRHRPEEAGRC
jgi:hypothetical protein